MKYHEILNFPLWKQLPYEIKVVLYIAVKGLYELKGKRAKFNPVIEDIRRNKTYIDETLDKLSLLNSYNQKLNILYSCHPQWDNNIMIFDIDTIKYHLEQETYWFNKIKDIEYEIEQYKRHRFFYKTTFTNSLTRRIIFNSEDIRDMYGNIVWIYYKSKDNKWVRFQDSLSFAVSFRINRFDLHDHILISNVDTLDEKDNVNSTLPIIFEFKFSELLSMDFKFKEAKASNFYHKNMFI